MNPIFFGLPAATIGEAGKMLSLCLIPSCNFCLFSSDLECATEWRYSVFEERSDSIGFVKISSEQVVSAQLRFWE